MLQRNEIARIQSNAALTDSTLVAAQADKIIILHWVLVTSAAAGTVTIRSGGSERLFETYPDASGGAAFSVDGELARAVRGEALTVSSDITGAHFVAVGYTVRG